MARRPIEPLLWLLFSAGGVIAALLIGIINAVLGGILRPRREERERR